MNAKKRLKEYLDYKNISSYEFSKATGLSNGFVNSGDSISSKNLEIISRVYVDLNLTWIITGKEDKIKAPRINLKNYSINDPESLENIANEDYIDANLFMNKLFDSLKQPDFKEFIAVIHELINSQNKQVKYLLELIDAKNIIIASKDELLKHKDDLIKSKDEMIRKLKAKNNLDK